MDLELAQDLGALLTLEQLDRDLFRARNANYGPRQTLYGGQVAAQCLLAAAATVGPDRLPHSFHGYFLRAGRLDLPVILDVDRDRDGRSFSARHVIAVQDGEVIFSMVTSFHVEREGTEFDAAPRQEVPEPEGLARFPWNTVIEVREVTPTDFLKGVFTDCLWVRPTTKLGDDPLLHRAALTFLSDLGTGFGQQDRALIGRGGPSIDHSVWFHDGIRADDWVLLDLRPVKARSARGLYTGSIRDRNGALGATVQQEQLLLPGHASDMLREQAEQASQASADREVRRGRRDSGVLREAQDRHPSGH
ncbi:MAG TPA: acyl-CoA thioesterase domain-containing protein [Acidimicrobiales bacterium]|nr:acyl-CoA thioesterase domain-containing protein [Acidimicrobiales bacterium]